MRDTKITEGCLGNVAHNRKLKVGDVQKMVVRENDLPPVTDQYCPKYDTPLGVFDEKNMTIAELRVALEHNSLNSNSNKTKFFQQCQAAGISTIKRVKNPLQDMLGKPKELSKLTLKEASVTAR